MPGTDSYRVFLNGKERRELCAPLNNPFPTGLGNVGEPPRDRYLEETAER
jgi:hypothetical protein